jgi:hypothetical protein
MRSVRKYNNARGARLRWFEKETRDPVNRVWLTILLEERFGLFSLLREDLDFRDSIPFHFRNHKTRHALALSRCVCPAARRSSCIHWLSNKGYNNNNIGSTRTSESRGNQIANCRIHDRRISKPTNQPTKPRDLEIQQIKHHGAVHVHVHVHVRNSKKNAFVGSIGPAIDDIFGEATREDRAELRFCTRIQRPSAFDPVEYGRKTFET